MVSAPPVLEASDVVRRYGSRTVLELRHLHVHRGEVLAIVGPNGAGKSTLFRILLLLERPDAGTVRLDGTDMRHRDARARGRIAGVFQRPVLFNGTVRDNVSFGLRATGMTRPRRRERVDAALGWLGLSPLADAPVHALSGGEAQRVALARALVLEPDVLLLDEPTSSLDVTVRRRFRQDLERVVRQRAGGVILITHDATEALGLADRIAVMQDGRIVQLATPEDIVLRPGSPFVAELTGAELLLHGFVETVDDGLAAVRLAPGVTVWAAVAADSTLHAGEHAVVAYRPEDIILATGHVEADTSAVNRMPCVVDAIVPAGALVRVRLRAAGDIVMAALLTRRSLELLGLASGSAVTAHIKATALHAWVRDIQRL
ncbi:MAG TPA: ABC transporter ATP-binding protein [Longimicrobiales bacterium]